MRNWTRLLATATIAAALAMAGCSGDDGKDGAPGPTGPAGPQGPEGPPAPGPTPPAGSAIGTLAGSITNVEIDTSASTFVTVTFEVLDAAGLPVTGLQNFEFTIAKLLTDGEYPRWQSYINRSRLQSGGVRVLRAAGERQVATEVADGVYEYTFKTDLEAVKDFIYYGAPGAPAAPGTGSSGELNTPAALAILPTLNLDYDPSALHRVSVVGRESGSRYNATIDFVPASLPTLQDTFANQVITTESCGTCHGLSANRGELHLPNVHGNGRYTMETCVACHNESTFDSRGSTDTEWAEISLTTMIHKMHLNGLEYSVDGRDYTSIHYPQSISNCLTCHDNNRMPKPEGRSAADAVAFQERPSAEACGTCHELNFQEGTFQHFFADAGPAACFSCHGPNSGVAPVANFHISPSSTPNNPLQPAGLVQYEYQIASVTVNELNQPTVTFRLLANGVPVNVQDLPAGMSLGNMRFYAAWSAPHPGGGESGPAIAMPQDYNNLGTTVGRAWWLLDLPLGPGGVPIDDPALTTNAQKAAVALKSFDQPRQLGNLSAFVDTLTPAADGYFVTAPGVNAGFAYPADATLKAIHIEGRPQSQGVNIDTSMRIAFAGTPRRQIVSEASCLACHETIAFHGSSRIDGPDACATCHNPENSSSNIFSGVIPEGVNAAYTGTFITGQLSMNLKDLVHATHAGKPVGGAPIREIPFSFIRGNAAGGGGGNGPYDFSDIGYPAALSDCQTCHLPDTYKLPLNGNALWSVVDGYNNATAPSVTAPHDPSATVRIGPVTATCYGCHNTQSALTHFELNATTSGEACAVCHGPGKIVPGHVD